MGEEVSRVLVMIKSHVGRGHPMIHTINILGHKIKVTPLHHLIEEEEVITTSHEVVRDLKRLCHHHLLFVGVFHLQLSSMVHLNQQYRMIVMAPSLLLQCVETIDMIMADIRGM